MMIDELRWWKPEKLPKYPHLGKLDAFTADMYWKDNIFQFDSASYDVIVGGGRSTLPGFSNALTDDWMYLSSLKIDMIGRRNLNLTICELKPFADSGSIGQVLTYGQLFVNKFAVKTQPELCVICMETHPDIIKAANALNVRFVVCSIDGPSILY
jgi:hypothetical protein